MKCREIHSLNEWEDIKKNTSCEIIIFKFSEMSTVSFVIEKQFEMWAGKNAHENIDCYKVNVVKSKELSLKISSEQNIKHESPQLIWLKKNLELKWTAHHHLIKFDTLNHLLIN
ncbi:MAG: thioredoxin family protein [Melioribacteraceae bacterium]|nr:thioredoxin family protein [Melioribacteraceae bacterium]MCF8266384.1 thioredoxin family protein [Melioribacteraceae bacterium]MCF8412901.1 thioredoxin family protein [Melioribacteraceae bacterium]